MGEPNPVISIFASVAGEHYVAYRLSIMGYLVARTRGHYWPRATLMVGHMAGHAAATLQVNTSIGACRRHGNKSSGENHWRWEMGERHYMPDGHSFCYAFVDLKYPCPLDPPEQIPDVFIVPAQHIADQLSDPNCLAHDVFVIKEQDSSKYFEAWHHITDHIGIGLPKTGPTVAPPSSD